MPTFRECEYVRPLLERIKKQHHRRLVDADVTIGLLSAHAPVDDDGDPKGPALKLHGVQCAATVRIVSHKDRVAGLPDAIVTIDGDRWEEFGALKQEAIIDHELAHLLPTGDTDDCGRPKLKMRPHDVDLGGFHDIVERHKENAPEAEIFLAAQREWTQKLLPFEGVA